MKIMTKINDFEEIFFKSSIIFHVFAHAQRRTVVYYCPAFYFHITPLSIYMRAYINII